MTLTAADLFAGMGGFTEGARQAGIRVVYAANHWQAAVDTHALNHPDVQHVCQDLHQANWDDVPRHDVLLASPSCQGHSRARGTDKPRHDAARSTAWAVVSCAEVHRPKLVLVENVSEMATNWVLFPAWRSAMTALGYTLSPHILDAADYGVPQNRKRLIIICTRTRYPLMLRERSGPHVPAASFIDWDAEGWRKASGLVPASMKRIAHGRRQFGERFLISYYGNTDTARSIERPIGTITTKDRWAVIDGNRMRMLNVQECRAAMGFPPSYQLPASTVLGKHMLGNAVAPPMIAAVLREIREAA